MTDAGAPSPPLQTVLACTDFSKGAEAAFARAAALPIAPGGRLHLVHVLPAGSGPRDEEFARAALDRLIASCAGRADVACSSEVLRGPAHRAIAEAAAAHAAELVVVGRHGTRRFRDQLVGTTTERVVRAGDVPVLVVRRSARQPYERLLVAVDLPPEPATGLVRLALRLGPFTGRREILHVHDDSLEAALRRYHHLRSETGAERRRQRMETVQALRRWVDRDLPRDGGPAWRLSAPSGDPRARILGRARAGNADLVAIHTQARTGLDRLLLGSVAAGVLRYAPGDVLVARLPEG